MNGRTADESDPIDRKTSRSICNAVGERLHEILRPEMRLTPYLQYLIDELKKRDRDGGLTN